MSIIANNLLQGDDGYNLTRSLRFRKSASAYLNRTPASAGNRKTWTWSGWIKRGSLGALQNTIFAAGTWTNPKQLTAFAFATDNTLTIASGFYGVSTDYTLNTTAVFRDPSAYYHLILAYDTTQATASNRVKLYCNGVQQTLTGSYPALNYDTAVNSTLIQKIGMGSSSELFDGYLTEVNFIDGQALTPSSFGETDVLTGVWKPKKYTGTYGTNGFYLPFTDVATTSGSNAGLGKDFSGNGNYWTTNNISVTSGSTYDSMIDVPTLTSASAANYCVANPLAVLGNSNVTIAGGNLDVTIGVSGGWRSTPASTFSIPSTGKWYFEVTQKNVTSGGNCAIGILQSGVTYTGNYYFYNNAYGFAYINDGTKGNNNSTTAYGSSWTAAGDNIGVAIDMSAGTLTFYKNGVSQGSAYTFDTTREYFVMLAGTSSVPQYSINYGQRPFSYTPPTGFVALNTFNLPEPSIKQGNKHFDATTWTGDGTSGRSINNSGAFQPDLVWTKYRSAANNHLLSNSVNGVANYLKSNTTDAEQTLGNTVTAFNASGFTIGSSGDVNTNGATYVGWQWKAGGSAVTNTAGSITSQVSANPTAGFSIVTWTGTAGSSFTIGHGLGVTPKMIVLKNRSRSGTEWCVYHQDVGNTKALFLNSTGTGVSDSGFWNNTTPTPSVFTTGNGYYYYTGATTDNYVAYCFSEIAGYSKFGSYTGNGSADGTFVYTGFRPRFIMIKRTDSATSANWNLIDTSRDTYNAASNRLNANISDAEYTGTNVLDILSNGFKLRWDGTNVNASGGSLIYAAFAEVPQKYSLAR